MPYKTFCDRCDKETEINIHSLATGQCRIELDHWTIYLTTPSSRHGDVLCPECLEEIFYTGQLRVHGYTPRPRVREAGVHREKPDFDPFL